MNQKFDINSTKQQNITEEIEMRKLALKEAKHYERLDKKPNNLAPITKEISTKKERVTKGRRRRRHGTRWRTF